MGTEDPTTERRIRAAMALAGLNFQRLAERIGTPNYGAKTLANLASEHHTQRQPRPADLHIIGRACGVSDAFWTTDFGKLQDRQVADELNEIRDELEALALVVAQQAQQLRELRDQDHRREPPATDPR